MAIIIPKPALALLTFDSHPSTTLLLVVIVLTMDSDVDPDPPFED